MKLYLATKEREGVARVGISLLSSLRGAGAFDELQDCDEQCKILFFLGGFLLTTLYQPFFSFERLQNIKKIAFFCWIFFFGGHF